MKITKVDVMELSCPGCVDRSGWRPIVCRIYTDEGIYGDGEAALAYGRGAPAAFGMIQEYAQEIIGRDPLDNEVIWDHLYRNTFWAINGGPITFAAISAIDMALWDIRGKYFGVPVYKLLGGKKRDSVRCYASQLQLGWGPVQEKIYTIEQYVDVAKRAVADGYDAIKIDFFSYDEDGRRFNHSEENTQLRPHYYIDLIERRVKAVREAVGPFVDIIAENHVFTDTNSAIQIGQAIQKYNIFMFEEGNVPFLSTVLELGQKVNIPIAHGERIYTRWQYAPYFEKTAIQCIQPDVGTCGGITELKKICDMAHTYDIGVQVHACGSPLSTVAALQVECVIPNFVIHEHHRNCLLPYNIALCKYDWQPENGQYVIPDLPGLGNEFTDEAIANATHKVTIE